MSTYRILKQDSIQAVSELLCYVDLEKDERIVIQKLLKTPTYVEVTHTVERVF